jgi:hypothetical protein
MAMTITTITKTLDYVTEIHTGSAAAPRPESQTEFERFEDLASKVVQVSKEELDEERGKA